MKAYCDGLTENADWLKGLGAEPYMAVMGPGYEGAQSNQNPEYPEIDGAQYMGAIRFTGGEDKTGPKHIAVFLQQYVESTDVDYQKSTPMTALVQDPESGAILGVVAGEKGNKYYKANGGVIMCTGGFENDAEYLENYMGMQGVTPAAALENTADGHRACAKAGAAMWHMKGGACFWMAPRNLENTEFTQTQPTGLTKEFGITVGVNGRRFYNDWDACAAGDVLEIGSDLRTNVGYRHGATQWGGRWVHLPLPPKAWFVYDAAGLAAGALPENLRENPDTTGWAYKANTIEELAALIDVPADELAKTVSTWNTFCDNGEDLAFYRPSNHMTKVAEDRSTQPCAPRPCSIPMAVRCAMPRLASSIPMATRSRTCTPLASSVPSGATCIRVRATLASASYSAVSLPATLWRNSTYEIIPLLRDVNPSSLWASR